MTHLITGVNAQDVDTLVTMIEEMVISHHKVESFDELRTKSKKTLKEWYEDSLSSIEKCELCYGYKLYSGDDEFPSETLLMVISTGHVRVESSIQ